MNGVAESKVGSIIKSLSMLEDDLDSLHSKASDMKKNLSIKAQSEIDRLLEEVHKMAAAEAEKIITEARAKAQSQAEKITQDGEERLKEIQTMVDANFDEAVEDVVSAVLEK